MPLRDTTGPFSQGPLTGRGLGACRTGLGWRNFFGFGRGLGISRLFRFSQPQIKETQRQALADYKKELQDELEAVLREEESLK